MKLFQHHQKLDELTDLIQRGRQIDDVRERLQQHLRKQFHGKSLATQLIKKLHAYEAHLDDALRDLAQPNADARKRAANALILADQDVHEIRKLLRKITIDEKKME